MLRFRFRAHLITEAVALFLLLPSAALGGSVVTNCTEANLRAAMAGGGSVTFACDGTIFLATTITNEINATLDGSGLQVTISGNNSVRVFLLRTNVVFALINLTIANGRANRGGGIYNDGGTLFLDGVSILANSSTNPPASTSGNIGAGGAIYNAGKLQAWRCSFSRNRAVGSSGATSFGSSPPGYGYPGEYGAGGAIYNEWFADLFIDSTLFASNSATGGNGGNGAGGNVGPGSFGDQTGRRGGQPVRPSVRSFTTPLQRRHS